MRAKDRPLPALIFPAAKSTERKSLAELKKEGLIRPIGPRLYTSVAASKVPDAVRGSWSTIVSKLFPGTLLSHRSALEYKPGPQGEIILTSNTNRAVQYPGLRLVFVRGPGPLKDDPKFLDFRASSLPRAMLESLSTHQRSRYLKEAPLELIEARLEQMLRDSGEDELNRIRDRAKEISKELGLEKEFVHLNKLIGALLGSHPTHHLKSAVARARAVGEPYDTECLERLQVLFGDLRTRKLPEIRDPHEASDHFTNKAFFEAYFSNYIEGTTFEVAEAEEIIFNKKVPANRPKDAHDILGTFRIVSDLNELKKTPRSFEELNSLLSQRHKAVMESRPEACPGLFKEKPNRAGDTVFVAPDLVKGTLRKGLELYFDLEAGLPRSIFMMFLIADIHPFADGNGRIARIMMNAELASRGLSTIIIPNVYREDYLLALRALTRRNRPSPLIDTLLRAQKFSTREFSPYPRALKELTQRNWFREPNEARIVD